MQTRVRGKSTPCASTRTTDEERSQSWPSWALHLSWPGAPPASSLLAGLSKPPLQGSRRWAQGIWQGGIFRLGIEHLWRWLMIFRQSACLRLEDLWCGERDLVVREEEGGSVRHAMTMMMMEKQ